MNLNEGQAFAELYRIVIARGRVGLLLESGDVLWGTARVFTNAEGGQPDRNADVMDLHVRITSTAGFEHYLPVRDLCDKYTTGEFCVDVAFPR